MNFQQAPIKDFVAIPRRIRDDYVRGELSRNELDVLLWIWLNTNPVNGYFMADYKALEREFRDKISYDNVRKITSSLRKKQDIYFPNHKGRKGSFPIYPVGFKLTNGEIQTLDYLRNKFSVTTQSQPKEQLATEPKHNSEAQYHNFAEQKEILIKRFSMDSQRLQITTSYNDNDTKNNNIIDIDKKKYLEEPDNRFAYGEIIPVSNFYPKTYEEEVCWTIAKDLGESDMRFLLSSLKRYGFHHIERVWGIFQDTPKERIQNQRKYFNKLIKKLAN
jgi:hypothetical protein